MVMPGGMALVLVAVGALAALGQVTALWLDRARLKNLLKPIPVLCMAACLVPSGGAYSRWILMGLVLSAAGDVLLEGKGQAWFLSGLTAFLCAHMAYLAAFLRTVRNPALMWALPPAVYGALVAVYLWRRLGPMRIPVMVYVAVICAMVWRAAAFAAWAGPAYPAAEAALAGAVLFALSDTLLSYHLFVRPGSRLVAVVNGLYWLGQAGLAYSAWQR